MIVVLPTDTENTFILSLDHNWTALHSHKNQLYAPNKAYKASIVCYRLLPNTDRLPSLSWCRPLCQKCELFLVEPHVKSHWTVLVGYLTTSTSVSCYQTHCRQQYFLPFSNTAHACTSAWCAQHSSTAAAQNSQLHFSWAMVPTGQSWTQLITRFKECTSVNMSFESTKLKKSSSDRLNSGKAVIQHLNEKDAVFMFLFCYVVQKH